MKRPYTTLTGKPICRACNFQQRGGKSRVSIPHTCGLDEAKVVRKELKSLKKNKKIFKTREEFTSTSGANTHMLWVPDDETQNE